MDFNIYFLTFFTALFEEVFFAAVFFTAGFFTAGFFAVVLREVLFFTLFVLLFAVAAEVFFPEPLLVDSASNSCASSLREVFGSVVTAIRLFGFAFVFSPLSF